MSEGPMGAGIPQDSPQVVETSSEPTEQAVIETQGQEPQVTEPQVDSGNPAWQEFLDVLPSSLHPQITPVLKKWDQGVQERFQGIHEEYAPYKEFKEQGIDPQILAQGAQLIQQLNENPRQVWDQMAQYYKFAAETQQPDPNVEYEPDEDEILDPRVSKLEEGVKALAQLLISERQEKSQAAEDEKLQGELTSLREKYGDYDEQYVLSLMLNGKSPEDAVKSYGDLVNKVKTDNNRPPAPAVVGGGGGAMPSNPVNPAKMSPKERREFTAKLLEAAHES